MEVLSYILITIFVAAILYVIIIFNQLVHLRNNVKKSWSNIDVLLKQRNDELPKLVSTCKEYMKYEQSILNDITKAREEVWQARSKSDMKALGSAESHLRTGLGALFARAENYPELRTNDSFLQLQSRISTLEDHIADRRELYNAAVNINNIRIEQFPDMIIAKVFNFIKHELLSFDESELKDVNIGKLFG